MPWEPTMYVPCVVNPLDLPTDSGIMSGEVTKIQLYRFVLALVLACGLGGVAAHAGEVEKILMVGNSLTYAYDIPAILEHFAADTKRTLVITRHVTGGKDLTWHWSNPSKPSNQTAVEAINQGGYDLVILQDHSQRVSKAEGRTEFVRVTAEYTKLIAAKSMRSMFYMGHNRDPNITPESLQPTVDMYTQQADVLGIPCAPVALAFLRCNQTYPKLALLDNQTDRTYGLNKMGTHQSPFGAYLAACTIWSALYGQSPVGLTFHAAFDAKKEIEIAPADAAAAHESAWLTWQEFAKQRPGAAPAKAKKR